ncbi:Uncharacterised protein [Staphylococcus aureus]|nr:5'-nucleotidase family protein [Staphylococcus aureus subsp. aureus 112808A]SCU55492.1 Uncharacterised protein [Staphylococcus aureus]
MVIPSLLPIVATSHFASFSNATFFLPKVASVIGADKST